MNFSPLYSLLSQLILFVCRGVTKLDGTRGKKQVWRPMFEPEVFRKYSVLKKVLVCDIFGTFRRPPAIRRLHSNLAPGELCPLCPPRYAPATCSAASFLLFFTLSHPLLRWQLRAYARGCG